MHGNDPFSSGKNLLHPTLKIQRTVADKPVSGFTGVSSPQGFSKSVSAHPSDHLNSMICNVLMYSQKVHPTFRASDAISRSCHSSAASISSLGKEESLGVHAWTPAKILLQKCDRDLRYRAAHGALSHSWSTDPGADPVYGNEPTKLHPCQNAGWKLTVGTWMIAGRSGEKELFFEVIMATSIHMAHFLHALATLSSAGISLTAAVCKHRPASPTKLPNGLTSSTLHAAAFPSAVRPDVQRILLLFWLASVFSSIVYRNGVFIMNSIILVMK